jgi:hypothetical protein
MHGFHNLQRQICQSRILFEEMTGTAYLPIEITTSIFLSSEQFQPLFRAIHHTLSSRIKKRVKSDDFGIPLHLSHSTRFIDQVDLRNQEIYRYDGFIGTFAACNIIN